MEIRIVQIT